MKCSYYFTSEVNRHITKLWSYKCASMYNDVNTSVTRAYGRDFTIAVEIQKYTPAYYI